MKLPMDTNASLSFTRHPGAESRRYELRPKNAAPVYVRHGAPDGWSLPQGYEPRFTLFQDPAGTTPLAVVVRCDGRHLVVLTPDNKPLADLRLPPKNKRWRPTYEIHLPDGRVLRGREGTVPSLIWSALLAPFLLLYLAALFFSDSAAGTFTAPLRTSWRQQGQSFGRAELIETARGRFQARGAGLDHRVAYAQPVAKHWKP
ncbi:hypothetical protein ACFV3R_23285 [Streptomyces sp. NPDC059740]|uniref:hypothetical protein n=1 Tax=Streptomyces sp. NPDC059740 TaxID=3346926 RepID=UPI0036490135